MNPLPLLHIHAQHWYHTEAWLLGNRDGLAALRDAIDRVLAGEGEASAFAFVADGEGFSAIVVLDDSPIDSPSWSCAAVPYTNKHAEADYRSGDVIHPSERISIPRYRELVCPPEDKQP